MDVKRKAVSLGGITRGLLLQDGAERQLNTGTRVKWGLVAPMQCWGWLDEEKRDVRINRADSGVARRAVEQIWGAGIVRETSAVALITVKRMGSRNSLERGFFNYVS